MKEVAFSTSGISPWRRSVEPRTLAVTPRAFSRGLRYFSSSLDMKVSSRFSSSLICSVIVAVVLPC
jgi:hypothetical protein